MEPRESLKGIERDEESCVLEFGDNSRFRVEYLAIRSRCQCAKCKPRQVNEQRRLELEQEVARLRMEKPRVTQVGRYGLQFEWPSGCSSGIYSFSHLRKVADESGLELST